MSESTTPHAIDRAVLFQHGGELSEFAAMLGELAMPVDEYNAGFPDPDQLEGARLVIVSGKRLLESGRPNLSLWPRTIAVIDDSSRTLATHLSRIGVAMVIRRPIHPRALRLLLLHEIYRGPERRRRKRILIGHPIRISSGLFRSQATLLELSLTGARIELTNAPEVGTKIRILIGKELTKSKPVKLQAKVIRSIRDSGENDPAESEIGVAILDANRHAKTIKGILDRFALGPASWKTNRPHDEVEPRPAALDSKPEKIDSGSQRRLPPTYAPPSQSKLELENDDALIADTTAHESVAPPFRIGTVTTEPAIPDQLDSRSSDPTGDEISDAPKKGSDDSSERRRDARVAYDQRVVALGAEAARVLVGRDLSRGGMRIAATPSIAVGDVLRVALHSGTQTEPIIVLANALRDDGDDGLVLSFNDLSETQREQLEKIITSGLPVHANGDDLEDPAAIGEAIVVAEMLEIVSQESGAEAEILLDSIVDTSESVEDIR